MAARLPARGASSPGEAVLECLQELGSLVAVFVARSDDRMRPLTLEKQSRNDRHANIAE